MIVWNEFLNDARVQKEAETLTSNGYSVTVHALHTPGVTMARETLPSGVKIVRVARSPFWKLRKKGKASNKPPQLRTLTNLPRSKKILRIIFRLWTHLGLAAQMIKSRPDVVHAHDVNTLPTAWMVSKIVRRPLIYDAHEISTGREGYGSYRNLVGWIEKKIMPRVAGSITTTETRAKFFARAYKVPRPLVLQNRPCYSHRGHSRHIRDKLSLPHEWPIVLYQGGLQQGRGLAMLLQVALRLPETYFVYIGHGRLTESLKAKALELGLGDRVKFIPTVSLAELPTYSASADIGVQPIENTCLNHFSTDSNKLFEYVMAGLPVVAADLPEIRKIIEAHKLGALVNPGDTDGFVEEIKKLAGDKDLRNTYREKALEAAPKLSWESQEELFLAFYRDVCAGADN
jgi:glycosyltransferase involved in cell wall biosynthesis